MSSLTIQYYDVPNGLLDSFDVPDGQPVPVKGAQIILGTTLYEVLQVVFVYNDTEVFSIDVYVKNAAQ